MKNKFLKIITTTVIIALIAGIFCCPVSAAGSVLTYKVADDGYAYVYDCDTKATGTVTVPATVTISGKTYEVKYIGQKAFDGCTAIKCIKLSEGITAIKSRAFRNCKALSDLYIPQSLEICQYDVFEGCGTINVYCYTNNYPFFNVCSSSADLVINIIDTENIPVTEPEGEDDLLASIPGASGVGNVVTAIKNLINNILDYFNVNSEDDFKFPDDLPFELPELPFDLPIDIEGIVGDIIEDDSSSILPF